MDEQEESRSSSRTGDLELAPSTGLDRAAKRRRRYIPIRINLSTTKSAWELLLMMLKELSTRASDFAPTPHVPGQRPQVADQESKSLAEHISAIWKHHSSMISLSPGSFPASAPYPDTAVPGRSSSSEANSLPSSADSPNLHEVQQDIVEILGSVRDMGHQVIFILDELDKLTPDDPDTRKMAGPGSSLQKMQRIVSDLKYLLTESKAFHIFIAGKDVDDSWQEDQNKGEGLFESVFIQNIYLPSTFTATLDAALGPNEDWLLPKWKRYHEKLNGRFTQDLKQQWTNAFYREILHEIGIIPRDWTYNTGLVVLPHFSENELKQLLLRIAQRIRNDHSPEQNPGTRGEPGSQPGRGGQHEDPDTSSKLHQRASWLVPLLEALDTESSSVRGELSMMAPAPERRTRRIRYLLQYLTYKGRGIPRKILREFYALVQDTGVLPEKTIGNPNYWAHRGGIRHIVYLPTPVRQKMKFFSDIVYCIEAHPVQFRAMDDKVCVATFHIIDFILKFFQTGFSWSDMEYASFMTRREELYPSREMVTRLLQVFENVIIVRKDRRHRAYMLMPRIRHDLSSLYIAFGPEQIELRFTRTDFQGEIKRLMGLTEQASLQNSEERLESYKAQIRLGRINEQLGNHPEARLAYSKALRWIRADLQRLLRNESRCFNSIDHSAVITYVSSAMNVLRRLGYLYELERDFREALQCYMEAINLHEKAWCLLACDSSSHGHDGSAPAWQIAPGRTRCSRAHGETRQILDQSIGHRVLSGIPENAWKGHAWTSNQLGQVENVSFQTLATNMVPNTVPEKLTPFSGSLTSGTDAPQLDHLARHQPFNTSHDPFGLPRTLNMMAINLEKMWQRYAANKYLLLALDYYTAIGDIHGQIDQTVFMGQFFLRRRDTMLTAAWYLQALRLLLEHQGQSDPTTLTTRLPAHQNSLRANIFDHLGDICYATKGLALVRWEELAGISNIPNNNQKPEYIGKLVDNRMKILRRRLDTSLAKSTELPQDHPPETLESAEYFYTIASHLFTMKGQILRTCDVHMKLLTIRFHRIMEASEAPAAPTPAANIPDNEKNEAEDKQREELGKAAQKELLETWLAFWIGAEKTLTNLIDPRVAFNPRVPLQDFQPLELGQLLDRRRVGGLFITLGTMFMASVDRPAIRNLYADLSQPKNSYNRCDGLSRDTIISASDRIDRIFALLLDHLPARPTGSTEPRVDARTFKNGGIGIRSPLWMLCSLTWTRKLTSLRDQDVAPSDTSRQVGSGGTGGLGRWPRTLPWLRERNTFLCGILWHLADSLLSELGNGAAKAPDKAPPDIRTAIDKLHGHRARAMSMYNAELCLLGAHVMLGDSIRDLDAGNASRSLGVLYLRAIKELLALRAFLEGNTGNYQEGYHDDMQKHLALAFAFLQVAAKRFLVYALDAYKGERSQERSISYQLGNTRMAMGDLLMVKAESLLAADPALESSGNTTGARDCARVEYSHSDFLPGLESDWPQLREVLEAQEPHIKDLERQEVRRQAVFCYREATRHFLTEAEHYLKRYRFPAETYYLHVNITDPQLHWAVCKSIRVRLWDSTRQPYLPGQEASKILEKGIGELANQVFNRYPRLHERNVWLEDTRKIMIVANNIRPGISYLSIQAPSDADSVKNYKLTWVDPGDEPPTGDPQHETEQALKHYFRVFDDGLANLRI